MFESLITAVALAISVTPVPFGLFSPAASDLSVVMGGTFSPDGSTVYYAKSQPGYKGLTIFESRLVDGIWTEPEVASFSGIYRDTDPAVTPSGDAVVYASARPPGDGATIYKLWKSYLSGPKAGTTEPLPDQINGNGSSGHPTFASDGTLYFTRTAEGVTRLYYAPETPDGFGPSHPVAFPDDAPQVRDGDPAIAPDQSFVIFDSNRPASKGGVGLYISFHHQQSWCTPIYLDAPISTGLEFAPELTRDGRTLYFASARSSLVQPRSARADAKSFQTELESYAHGAVRIYSAYIGDWIAANKQDQC